MARSRRRRRWWSNRRRRQRGGTPPAGAQQAAGLRDMPREPPMTSRPLTVLFMPESAYGPTNNCIGIGDVLRRRGHRVVFAAEASWKGRLEPLGFEEDLVDLAPPAEDADAQDAGQFWTDFVIETAPEFRKPTIEPLA